MSVAGTCSAQRLAMRSLGLRVYEQRSLRDVDTIADARLVAAQAPGSRFAAALAEVDQAAGATPTGTPEPVAA